MPRISEPRAPALPATDEQRARRTAILRSAARLGRVRPLDQIQAQEIAAEAGVALRTLYRYYPSKHHVFAAVLTAQIENLRPPARRSSDAATAVAELMAEACRNMLRYKHLAHAMIVSTQTVRAHSRAVGDHAVRDTILLTAGITDPTPAQTRVARLVEQVTFGVLTWTVGGEIEPDEAVADVQRACRLLAADFT
ncbi:TetR family transcriptional regulator [Mycobacterium shigaense]|uniref:Putative transcriptional regulator, TetR family protein n=1 Tax=Mycobacterium shigaense TaxID=722731 RepID=A0A1Z4EBD8_9MYCO|nr:TetR family transcriptional regulator [Mycobacterium shigaense]PRI15290.1 TetR family transcriptional regulator [Mycobacterium shigaense]BAX90265.1 putative transcriptional regulator, TetR family protein [Mycobacterium shigaense]